jgi:hypothetical protein
MFPLEKVVVNFHDVLAFFYFRQYFILSLTALEGYWVVSGYFYSKYLILRVNILIFLICSTCPYDCTKHSFAYFR